MEAEGDHNHHDHVEGQEASEVLQKACMAQDQAAEGHVYHREVCRTHLAAPYQEAAGEGHRSLEGRTRGNKAARVGHRNEEAMEAEAQKGEAHDSLYDRHNNHEEVDAGARENQGSLASLSAGGRAIQHGVAHSDSPVVVAHRAQEAGEAGSHRADDDQVVDQRYEGEDRLSDTGYPL